MGNFVQNQVYYVLGRRYGTRTVEKHPDWKPRLQHVHRWLERFQSALIIGLRFVPGFCTMVPVIAGACLILEWSRARGRGQKWITIVRNQLLLWFGLLLVVRLVYLLLQTGRLNNENTGLINLLLLSLITFFAGIHLGWRLFMVGIFLGLALIGATYLEEFVWISKKCNFFLFSIF